MNSPVTIRKTSKDKKRPYFFWDYDLTNDEVKRLISKGTEWEKIWILSRILESANFEDIWKYTSLKQIKEFFPKLRLKGPIREAWVNALNAWS